MSDLVPSPWCHVCLDSCRGMLVGPDYKTPPTQMPAAFANQTEEGLSTGGVETSWWRGFRDQRLNQLVELALANNHDLRVATARIREARALLSRRHSIAIRR